jgi:hypothetical protein
LVVWEDLHGDGNNSAIGEKSRRACSSDWETAPDS